MRVAVSVVSAALLVTMLSAASEAALISSLNAIGSVSADSQGVSLDDVGIQYSFGFGPPPASCGVAVGVGCEILVTVASPTTFLHTSASAGFDAFVARLLDGDDDVLLPAVRVQSAGGAFFGGGHPAAPESDVFGGLLSALGILSIDQVNLTILGTTKALVDDPFASQGKRLVVSTVFQWELHGTCANGENCNIDVDPGLPTCFPGSSAAGVCVSRPSPSNVPEPSTLLLTGVGLVGLLRYRRLS